LGLKIAIAAFAFCLAACGQTTRTVSGPLPQRGYLWQREWTPAVSDAAIVAQRRMDGIVILGAEIDWTKGKPEAVRANIDWQTLKSEHKACALALRVAPYSGAFAADDETARSIASAAKSIVDLANNHGLTISELQLDFDCARKNLAGYRNWVRAVRSAIRPIRFVITTLPAWLDDPEFLPLVREADGYVLQVHSVPVSRSGGATLCDPHLANAWINKAARFHLPFSVALPTYRCTAGYNADGKLLSVACSSSERTRMSSPNSYTDGTQIGRRNCEN
jgi:hypothetical protein